ncbi:MAG: hypothetical protein IIB57_03475 [Planctomycetes bacterium]|nr:hypothetical protein [Planctomycetota bacterium]
MAQQWEVESASGVCGKTGRAFSEGEEFYTVLFEEGESFRRVDFAADAWEGPPEGCFCCFKSRKPVKAKKKKLLVDAEMLIGFFRRLEDETEPVRVQFRFVLALLLMRKRLLQYESSTTTEGQEVWEMLLGYDKSTHRVVNPHLTDDQIENVSRQLTAILHSDMGHWADQDKEPPGNRDHDDGAADEVADEPE